MVDDEIAGLAGRGCGRMLLTDNMTACRGDAFQECVFLQRPEAEWTSSHIEKIKPIFTFSTFLPPQTVNPHRKRKNFRFLSCDTPVFPVPWATFVPTHIKLIDDEQAQIRQHPLRRDLQDRRRCPRKRATPHPAH